MKLAEEKRALADISSLKRNRRNFENLQKDQEAIDALKAKADALRADLDDPEAKAISERFETVKARLDEIRKTEDELYSNRRKLFAERDAIKAQLDDLWTRKKDSAQRYREQNDRYYAKVQEDRARRAERARLQRLEDEQKKKAELVERLREEATAPAFQAQIEDCQTLIDYFSGKTSAPAVEAALAPKKEIAGVEKLEQRQVEALGAGFVALKKKGEEEESYFAGKAKKAKGGKKGGAKPAAAADAEGDAPASVSSSSKDELNMPLAILTALLSLSIPPPSSKDEVPRAVEDLKTKKAWFEANQKRVTAENIAKAEADIARILGSKSNSTAPTPAEDVVPANGGKQDTCLSNPSEKHDAHELVVPPHTGGEKPAEPAHTPQVGDVASVPVASEEVIEKLEPVAEAEAAA
jgi:hypothetical protein